jgi:hypothetical protein
LLKLALAMNERGTEGNSQVERAKDEIRAFVDDIKE